VFEDVVNYVNELHPSLLMHSLNYTLSTFKKGGAKSTFGKSGAKSEATVSEANVSEEVSNEEMV
jgi:hypothetical protein